LENKAKDDAHLSIRMHGVVLTLGVGPIAFFERIVFSVSLVVLTHFTLALLV